MRTVHLPPTTGPHPVGRRTFDLEDGDRTDPYARRRDTARRLPVAVWYPARTRSDRRAPYLPGAWRTVSWVWGLRARSVVTATTEASPAADGRFPLVVFSGSANPAFCYTALLSEIASHGYVVAGISHTYESMPLTVFDRGRPRLARLASLGGALATPGRRPYDVDLRERAAVVDVKHGDLAFVAGAVAARPDRFGLPVDGATWAAIGHSFGGGAAVEAARRGECRAAVSLDGGLWRTADTVGARGPVLQLFGEHPELVEPVEAVVARGQYATVEYAEADRVTAIGAWQALHDRATPGSSALVRGATHTSFSDWPLLGIRKWSPARRALGGVSGAGVWATVSRSVVCFLDRHLQGGDGDVGEALRADSAFEVGPPAALFAPRPAGGAA